MFDKDDVIDGKYRVTGVCSTAGGMGALLFVRPLAGGAGAPLVLKYCKESDEECLKRFRREVRLLASFKGNSKVVKILGHNLEHDPPYFVMKFYPDGDLLKYAPAIKGDLAKIEATFLEMIDCLQELHSRTQFHRDIKPQNFLVDGQKIVVSDFGLTTEIGSGTAFTRSSVYWGTHGYVPPEFYNGGFKHADAAGDIFMLGKTFYVILTGLEPLYLLADGVPPAIFHVIERCCSITKEHRYQSLAELKQSLSAAFDVLLGRGGGIGKVKQLLSAIRDRLEREQQYDPAQVGEFVEQLALLGEADQIRICLEVPDGLLSVLAQQPVIEHLPDFLAAYEKLVEGRGYSWNFAETIADEMRILFRGGDVPNSQKARALDLAIRAAAYMNRFAAMDSCKAMIVSVTDELLGQEIAAVLMRRKDTFVSDIEPGECNCEAIRSALDKIREKPNA